MRVAQATWLPTLFNRPPTPDAAQAVACALLGVAAAPPSEFPILGKEAIKLLAGLVFADFDLVSAPQGINKTLRSHPVGFKPNATAFAAWR